MTLLMSLQGSILVNAQSTTYKDAIICDLKGNVKSCTYQIKGDWDDEFVEGSTIEFDSYGRCSNSRSDVLRDSQNRVKEECYISEDWLGNKCTDYSKYEYDAKGRLITEYYWSVKFGETKRNIDQKKVFYYDSNGNIIKIENKDLTGERALVLVTEYEYIAFDTKGNWIERKYQNPITLENVIQKRSIMYY